MTSRVLFHVQHLLGVGHLRRAEMLAQAMTAAGVDVTMVLGGRPLTDVPMRGLRIVQLPPAQIANGDFSTLLDDRGEAVGESWRNRRRDALLTAYRAVKPDVVLIELFPFGRRQFAFELVPLLEAAHAERVRPRIAASARDILVGSSKPGRAEQTAQIARTFFDMVLVHGDPAVIPFEATFPAANSIFDLIRYTGYVAPETEAPASDQGHGEVIVSAGGGAVGGPLLALAMETRPETALADRTWRFITGPNMPEEDWRKLSARSDDRTIVERFRPDFGARLKTAALSISQAGYNTTMDVLSARVPAVVVPYETPSETEQRLRSDLLAARGLLSVAPAQGLTTGQLAAGIAEALGRPRPAVRIDLDGARKTAEIVKALAERGAAAALAPG